MSSEIISVLSEQEKKDAIRRDGIRLFNMTFSSSVYPSWTGKKAAELFLPEVMNNTISKKDYDLTVQHYTLRKKWPYFALGPLVLGGSIYGSDRIGRRHLSRFGRISANVVCGLGAAFGLVLFSGALFTYDALQLAKKIEDPQTYAQADSNVRDRVFERFNLILEDKSLGGSSSDSDLQRARRTMENMRENPTWVYRYNAEAHIIDERLPLADDTSGIR